MDGSAASSTGSSNQAMSPSEMPRSLRRVRALTPATTMVRPGASAKRVACVCMRRSKPLPTVPRPATPSLKGLIISAANVTPQSVARYAWFCAAGRGTF